MWGLKTLQITLVGGWWRLSFSHLVLLSGFLLFKLITGNICTGKVELPCTSTEHNYLIAPIVLSPSSCSLQSQGEGLSWTLSLVLFHRFVFVNNLI